MSLKRVANSPVEPEKKETGTIRQSSWIAYYWFWFNLICGSGEVTKQRKWRSQTKKNDNDNEHPPRTG
jgi:hypothetical protein